jgi:hypothetical protein
MPWTTRDHLRLARACSLYLTRLAASEALGLPLYSLYAYLSRSKKPRGNLAETALRERVTLVLQPAKLSSSPTSTKHAVK